MTRLQVVSVAAIAAHLLLVAAACQIANSDCRPAQFSHKLGQPPEGARSTAALWDLKEVQECLRTDAAQSRRESRAFKLWSDDNLPHWKYFKYEIIGSPTIQQSCRMTNSS
jgi:hypothetical protein